MNGRDLPQITRATLPSKVRVVVCEMPHAYSASCVLLFGAGSRYETKEQAGISHLFEHMLFKGTKMRPTPRDIVHPIEGVGGMFNAFTTREFTGYWSKTASTDYKQAADVLMDMVKNPLLRTSDIEKEKQVIFEEIHATFDSPSEFAELLSERLLWSNQPLGRDVAGSIESVAAFTREQMVQCLANQYVASNMVIALCGRVSTSRVLDYFENITSDLRDSDKVTKPLPFSDNLSQQVTHYEHRPLQQTHIAIAMPGLSAHSPQRYALSIMSAVLGEMMTSRLFQEIREARGLTYDVHSGTHNLLDTGAFYIQAGTDPRRAQETTNLIFDELLHLRDDGITQSELQEAKQYLSGRIKLQLENTFSMANFLGISEIRKSNVQSVDQLIANIAQVTRDEVKRVAESVINLQKLVFVAIGPAEVRIPNTNG